MPFIDQGLKDAVWLLLEITAQQQPGQMMHSDLIAKKFPKIDEKDIVAALGDLAKDGRLTLTPASVDAFGKPTSYHLRVAGYDAPQASELFADHAVAKEPTPSPTPSPIASTSESRAQAIPMGTGRIATNPGQQSAEREFSEAASAFFIALEAVPARVDEKRDLQDQLTVIIAMFQSADTESFTTPVAKLAAMKMRVQELAPELSAQYVALIETAVRAWLGRV